MKKRLIGIFGMVTLAIFSASLAVGQDSTLRAAAGDKWVISAKAGGVNFTQGSVSIERAAGRSGLLVKGDSIDVGDRVSTGENGRTEILLNPGSYLRVAENSSFEFKTTGLEDLQIAVIRGSVILEVYAANDFRVSVSTPKDSYDLIQTGVYRVDVGADGSGRIEVWKGKAEVGQETLKGGRTAVTTLDGDTSIAKFDRDERDDFETWSRARAKELAKATENLKDRELRTSLMRSFIGGRWNMYDSFGLWVYDTRFGRYCFLPFGYGWSSPYGFGFRTNIMWYGLPSVVYYPPTPRGTVAGTPTGNNPTPPASPRPQQRQPINTVRPNRRTAERPAATQPPPFARMQGSGRGTGPSTGGIISSSGRSGPVDLGGIRRVGSPPASGAQSAPSAPAPRVEPLPSRPSRVGSGRRPLD